MSLNPDETSVSLHYKTLQRNDTEEGEKWNEKKEAWS